MATAAALNATSSIIGGQGLAANATIISQITTFQNQPAFTLLSTIYTNANTYGNVGNVVIPILNTIGSTATQAQFLLDLYPSNITPVSSTSISYRFGSHASASGTIRNQALAPFAAGLGGFANVFSFAQSFATTNFDSAASVHMLKNKTYGQSGLNYKGITDLVTGGIGDPAELLGNTVSGWGTMYNITNINLIADPYVFGQNLLDQGFGTYGNLEAKLTATGLDTADITRVPATTTTTDSENATLTSQSLVGEIELPTVANVTVTNTVTGNSPDVVLAVYKTITGADLAAIVSATGFKTSGTSISTLADLLDFRKAVNIALLPALQTLGINSFATFTQFLNSRVGQGTFKNWAELGNFLTTVVVPKLKHTTTTSSSPVLLASTITTIQNLTGTGSGPFNNPVMLDFLGATSGTPYITHFPVLNSKYSSLIGPVYTALQNLSSAVNYTNQNYIDTIVPSTSEPPDPPNGQDGEIDASGVITAVAAVDAAMNNISPGTLQSCQTAYFVMLNRITTEVSNLNRAGVVFDAGPSQILPGFGQRMGSLGSPDPMAMGTDLFFANIITDDAAGDTIRAVMAEFNNNNILSRAGITLKNDPNPIQAVAQSQNQNIPLSTYLSRNK
jgi:hypothetical protein